MKEGKWARMLYYQCLLLSVCLRLTAPTAANRGGAGSQHDASSQLDEQSEEDRAIVTISGKSKDGNGNDDLTRRVVGGRLTSVRHFPHTAAVLRDQQLWCGAAIVHAAWLLTAAHCMKDVYGPGRQRYLSHYKIRTGSSSAQNGGVVSALRRVAFPREYRPQSANFDLALLQLSRKLQLGPDTAIVPLADRERELGPDDRIIVTGWGSTTPTGRSRVASRLQYVSIPVLSREECQRHYTSAITANMLCAGYPGGGRDACNHDSGGPAIHDNQLVGIVSFGGKLCGDPKSPGVYSRVSKAAMWIKSIIAPNFKQFMKQPPDLSDRPTNQAKQIYTKKTTLRQKKHKWQFNREKNVYEYKKNTDIDEWTSSSASRSYSKKHKHIYKISLYDSKEVSSEGMSDINEGIVDTMPSKGYTFSMEEGVWRRSPYGPFADEVSQFTNEKRRANMTTESLPRMPTPQIKNRGRKNLGNPTSTKFVYEQKEFDTPKHGKKLPVTNLIAKNKVGGHIHNSLHLEKVFTPTLYQGNYQENFFTPTPSIAYQDNYRKYNEETVNSKYSKYASKNDHQFYTPTSTNTALEQSVSPITKQYIGIKSPTKTSYIKRPDESISISTRQSENQGNVYLYTKTTTTPLQSIGELTTPRNNNRRKNTIQSNSRPELTKTTRNRFIPTFISNDGRRIVNLNSTKTIQIETSSLSMNYSKNSTDIHFNNNDRRKSDPVIESRSTTQIETMKTRTMDSVIPNKTGNFSIKKSVELTDFRPMKKSTENSVKLLNEEEKQATPMTHGNYSVITPISSFTGRRQLVCNNNASCSSKIISAPKVIINTSKLHNNERLLPDNKRHDIKRQDPDSYLLMRLPLKTASTDEVTETAELLVDYNEYINRGKSLSTHFRNLVSSHISKLQKNTQTLAAIQNGNKEKRLQERHPSYQTNYDSSLKVTDVIDNEKQTSCTTIFIEPAPSLKINNDSKTIGMLSRNVTLIAKMAIADSTNKDNVTLLVNNIET